jgi:hypothetical protein
LLSLLSPDNENMSARESGTTTYAPFLSKSSVSLEMAPMRDQSPLYLQAPNRVHATGQAIAMAAQAV